MPPTVHRKDAVIAAHRWLTPEVVELALRPSDPAGEKFRPGQYLMIEIDAERVRPYSIASPPSRPQEIVLCFNRVPHGPVSNYLAELGEGDRVLYTGPHGTFTLREGSSRDLLFVATGTGISPLRSMILDLLERLASRRIDLVFGTRRVQDLIYFDEFRHLESHYANFHYHVCISRPGDDGWAGHRGRVTTVLPRIFPELLGREAYICGRAQMVLDTTEVLVSIGLERSHCYREGD